MTNWPSGRRAGVRATFACAIPMLAVAVIALTGCGSTPAGGRTTGPAGTAQSVQCRQLSAADSVTVVHAEGLHSYSEQNGQDSTPGVSSRATARALAAALCSLPTLGHKHCALVAYNQYRLSFSADGHALPVVTVQATGCQRVTGLGPARTAASSPDLWTDLAKAVGSATPSPVNNPN